jgi:3-methylcrotonyl-CoA carboxylase alpha subunit
VHERLITFYTDAEKETPPTTVRIKTVGQGLYDVTVQTPDGIQELHDVSSELTSGSTITSTIDSSLLRTTIVTQPTPSVAASSHLGEQVHVFHGGRKITLTLPTPKWLEELGGAAEQDSSKFILRSPMPSLVVDVRVKVGDKVEKGHGLVILESMKTETLMRSDISGVVVSVAGSRGEMVKEGQELVIVEAVESTSESKE